MPKRDKTPPPSDPERPSDSPRRVDRRALLASAGALVGAAACKPKTPGIGGGPLDKNAPRPPPTEPVALHGRAVGFQLAHEQFPMRELVELGVLAERAGFDVVTASDHLQPWQSNQGHSGQAWITLSALGQRTSRVWLGTTVTCPSFRYNPAVVAQGFASLSALYPGRIFLGLGSGEAMNEQAATGEWPSWTERSRRLIEATRIIQQLWMGEQVDEEGTYFKVNARLYDPPPRPIPLLMAANGPQAMRRAGRYADGLVTDPTTWKEHRSEFDAGANEAGKNRALMPVFLEHYVVVGDANDARKAAELWRFGPKAWNPYFDVRDPARIEELATAEIPLEQVSSSWVVSTDPNVHVKALVDLFNSGVTEINVHAGQPDQRRVIDFYGKEVLPRLRSV